MTKVSVFGQTEKEEKKELKKIELVLISCGEHELWTEGHRCCASDYEDIVLLEKNYSVKYDLIFGRNIKDTGVGGVFLGHWNDGVV